MATTTETPTKLISRDELAKHITDDSAWISIHGKVYDITTFYNNHPGGVEILLDTLNKDATGDFEDIGHSDSARKMLDKLYVGDLEEPFSKQEHVQSSNSNSNISNILNIVIVACMSSVVVMFFGMSFESSKLTFA